MGVAVCPEGPALAREVLDTSTQISVTITKSRVIVFAIVIALGLTMWWRSQPDPPDVLFLTYVRGNPAARTVSGDSLINYGYSLCNTLALKGIDGVAAKVDADLASGIAYAGDVMYAAEVNLCPTQNNVPGSAPNGP